ncbi:MAG TPA: recombinase family protein, partial [Solirubrobacteraceae bacterium]
MSKIGSMHLRRAAYVYVRQSTLAQVERNTESLERQYELAERAVALGWDAGEVVVVDSDLGRSGKSTDGREGFHRLVADVGLGKVGIVLGIEVSRLARRNADWYQLLDLCALTDTLIADADGIYHPGLHNDRLLLGLKGTMSEAELHVLRTRMREGALHKVAKGELRVALPAGYEYDQLGQVRITPDEAIVDAIATVFAYFDELSSARQVMLRLLSEGRQLPRGGSDHKVRWMAATYRVVHTILTNPCYAGVYAYGRKRVQRRVVDGVVVERMRSAPREEWHTCLIDHHPGFITFERYEANLARLRANSSAPRSDSQGAAREGSALLQGLASCGRCGRRMQVSYSGGSRVPRYSCVRGQAFYGTERCQSIGGRRVEQVVLDAVFLALRPAAIDATLRAIEDLTSSHQARVHSAELDLERARYDADRARRKFDGCEPENRLVGRTLESEWERQLHRVREAEHALATVRASRPEPLTEQEIAWCRHAGADLHAVFDAPTTTDRDRKLLLRSMITEVQVTVERERQRADVRIVWEGGALTDHHITVPPGGPYAHTDQDTVALVRGLAEQHHP